MLSSFPRAIIHIDGDAFFASCEQARDPALRGKPVICGKERGIAASMSYEAKARGVTRAMPLFEIRQLCPDAIILPSDYETYSLLSKRFYDIVRRFTPDVEEYSIDECFADLTGLRRCFHASYGQIARKIQETLAAELGFTFSIGLAPTKVLAKLGSKWKKPHGLTVIPGPRIHEYIDALPAGSVWGIGPQTAAFLQKHRIETAGAFAQTPRDWVLANLTKPHHEIWHELNGVSVLSVNTQPKTSYASIQKFKTFTPPSTDRAFVFSQLSKNIENACIKARRYNLEAREAFIILRRQDFAHNGVELTLSRATNFPAHLIDAADRTFDRVFRRGVPYRATGIVLGKLEHAHDEQPDLFDSHVVVDRMRRIYESVDRLDSMFGKHTVYLGTSHMARTHAQHEGARGNRPTRTDNLFSGENGRQRLAIPMLEGKMLD